MFESSLNFLPSSLHGNHCTGKGTIICVAVKPPLVLVGVAVTRASITLPERTADTGGELTVVEEIPEHAARYATEKLTSNTISHA
jgi:hypothetical protein